MSSNVPFRANSIITSSRRSVRVRWSLDFWKSLCFAFWIVDSFFLWRFRKLFYFSAMIVHVRFHVRVCVRVYIFRFKGSAGSIHFIFEIIVGSNSNSESFYVGSVSFRHWFKNELACSGSLEEFANSGHPDVRGITHVSWVMSVSV